MPPSPSRSFTLCSCSSSITHPLLLKRLTGKHMCRNTTNTHGSMRSATASPWSKTWMRYSSNFGSSPFPISSKPAITSTRDHALTVENQLNRDHVWLKALTETSIHDLKCSCKLMALVLLSLTLPSGFSSFTHSLSLRSSLSVRSHNFSQSASSQQAQLHLSWNGLKPLTWPTKIYPPPLSRKNLSIAKVSWGWCSKSLSLYKSLYH